MDKFVPVPQETDRVAAAVIDAAYKVHRVLGPGLLESFYETCLCHELKQRNIAFKGQVPVPVTYEGIRLDANLRLDLLVADLVVVEIKAVESLQPVFTAQVLTYLKLTGMRLGLLINFNTPTIRTGIKRVVL